MTRRALAPTVTETVTAHHLSRETLGFTIGDSVCVLLGPPTGRRHGRAISSGVPMVAALGPTPIDRLTKQQLQAWFVERHRLVGQEARRRGMACVRSWLKHCIARGHLDASWLLEFKPIKKPKGEHPWLTTSTLLAVDKVAVDTLDDFDLLAWQVLTRAGLRRSELPLLRAGWLDADSRVIHMGKGTKGFGDGKPRSVPVPRSLCDAWKAHVKRHGLRRADHLLFRRKWRFTAGGRRGAKSWEPVAGVAMTGSAVGKLVIRVLRACEEAERAGTLTGPMPGALTPVVLRRTWAAHQYLNHLMDPGRGLELRELSRALGHSELSTTEIYLADVKPAVPEDRELDIVEVGFDHRAA